MTNTRMALLCMGAVFLAAAACGGKPEPRPAEFTGGAGRWSWARASGPDHWGDLAPEFALCKSGKQQTPLALSTADATTDSALTPLLFAFPAAPLKLVHNGRGVDASTRVDWQTTTPAGPYRVAGFHFHSPSEHTVDGKQFDAELHFVHKNASGQLAVIALLFTVGAENVPLQAVFAHEPRAGGPEASTDASVDLGALLPGAEPYFTYSGSLTTPPCSEGLTWFVFETPRSLSQGQLDSLRATMNGPTNRPLQQRGERTISRFAP